MDLKELKLLSKITPESINNAYKTDLIITFMNIKTEQQDLSQDQICGKLGISSSTIEKIRQDLNVKSANRYNIHLKSKKKVEINELITNLISNKSDTETLNK
jgi:hypothetical protein